MAFTFEQTNEANTSATYDLEITIDPTTAVITADSMEVGETAAGTIAVSNTGAVNAQIYLTADWGPSTGTSDRDATVLASALVVSVFASADTPTDEFGGRFIDLVDQAIIDNLAPDDVTEIYISLTLPDDHTGPTLLNKAILSDFIFVAVSTSAA